MSSTYDLYGINESLHSAAMRVSALLDVDLVLHSSDYLGGDYYCSPDDDTVEVIRNGPYDDPDDIPYEQYANYSVIVEVNESPCCDEYRDKLVEAGFVHLEREVLDDV